MRSFIVLLFLYYATLLWLCLYPAIFPLPAQRLVLFLGLECLYRSNCYRDIRVVNSSRTKNLSPLRIICPVFVPTSRPLIDTITKSTIGQRKTTCSGAPICPHLQVDASLRLNFSMPVHQSLRWSKLFHLKSLLNARKKISHSFVLRTLAPLTNHLFFYLSFRFNSDEQNLLKVLEPIPSYQVGRRTSPYLVIQRCYSQQNNQRFKECRGKVPCPNLELTNISRYAQALAPCPTREP